VPALQRQRKTESLASGDSTEIANIKRKLEEVKQSAEKAMEWIKQAEAASSTSPNLWTSDVDADEEGKGRVLKIPLIRKELGMGRQDLVDDNGEEIGTMFD
jgi:phosphopantetheinyl transferase